MTQEQKAKRYDELIAKLIKAKEDDMLNDERYCCVIDEIVPELAESEDERIRKALIHLFQANQTERFGEFTNKQFIDWLELQGHHKKFRDAIQVGDNVTRNRDGEIVNLSQLKRVAKKDEKYGEHKPFNYESANIQQKDFATPRYSIGDVLCDKSCTTLNKESQSNFKITDIRNGMYICDKCSFPISQQDEYELVQPKSSLWKSIKNELPKMDREVIVLTQPYPLEGSEYAVSFGHIVNSDYAESYDGWNIPNVKWWLDLEEFPK